ncbi:SAV_915 family protein [Saccharopolyspora sp. ID03-671]|uniref:SAV_915 family protein n=1 Tax=Saccharopolyspora sp. ID03-671 TaxID=3073066 RepID=UPI0032560AD8
MPVRWDGDQQWEGDKQSAAPAVFGPEYSGFETEDAVQTAYLPCERVGPRDREANIELRQDGDQRVVMLAYSSLEALIRGCGEAQPWLAVPVNRISQVEQDTGAEIVLWDLDLPSEARRQGDSKEDR